MEPHVIPGFHDDVSDDSDCRSPTASVHPRRSRYRAFVRSLMVVVVLALTTIGMLAVHAPIDAGLESMHMARASRHEDNLQHAVASVVAEMIDVLVMTDDQLRELCENIHAVPPQAALTPIPAPVGFRRAQVVDLHREYVLRILDALDAPDNDSEDEDDIDDVWDGSHARQI